MSLAHLLSLKVDQAWLAGGDLHVVYLKVLYLQVPSPTPPQGIGPSEGLTAQVWRQTSKQLQSEQLQSGPADMDETGPKMGTKQAGVWMFG